MKKCFKCDIKKPFSDFYKHKDMLDGYLGKCKVCAKNDVNAHRSINIDKIRAYDRDRGCRQTAEQQRGYRKNNPVKYKSHSIVSNAIKTGRLVRPNVCEKCSKKCKPHAHHCDYDKPLEVNWFCAACHKRWHIENGEGKNGNISRNTAST